MEPILHFFLPLLFVLALFPKLNRRLIYIMSPLTILPDFDWFFGHRYFFHNIFFIFAISIVVYIIFDKKKIVFLLALFFLGSHLILELDRLGVGLFYPLYQKLIGIDVGIYSSPGTTNLGFNFELITNSLSEATKMQMAPGFTKHGLFLLLLLIPLLLVKYRSIRK